MGKSDPVYYHGTIEAFNSAFLTFIGKQNFESGYIYDGFKSLCDLKTNTFDYNLENLEVYKNRLKKIINDNTNNNNNNTINTFLEDYFSKTENISFSNLFPISNKNDKQILLDCFPFMYKGKCNSDSKDECYLYKPYSNREETWLSREKEITPKKKDVNNKDDKINYIRSLIDKLNHYKKKLNNNIDKLNNNKELHQELNTILQENRKKIKKLYGENIPNNDDNNLEEHIRTVGIDEIFNEKLPLMLSDYEYIKNYQTIKFIVKSEEIFKGAIKDIMYLEKTIANIIKPDPKSILINNYATENGWNNMDIDELNELLKTEEIKLADKKKQQTELNKYRGEKTEIGEDDRGKPEKYIYHSYKDTGTDKNEKYYDRGTWNVQSEEIGYEKCKAHIDNLENYIEYKTEDENSGGKSRRKKKRTKKSKKRTKKSKKSKRKRSRKCRK
jgi:hypothetical protein